jgi:hypothetical protein
MNLLAGSIRYEHYALVRPAQIAAALHCSDQELKEALNRLKAGRYLLFADSSGGLRAHVNPRLAWKGIMTGSV